nr:regulatory protein [Salmonella sp. NCTC 7297]
MMSSTCCKKGRAQIGLIEARDAYPTDIGATRLPVQSWMGVYVATTHPLASQTNLQWEQLHTWRELRLNTYLESNANITRGPAWSAPNYLLLLSMAVSGIWLVRIALRAGGRVCGGKTAGAAGCSWLAEGDCY